MRFDLPDCKRCCLCVPLRHGILIFGYLNLAFSLFVITVELVISFRPAEMRNTNFLYRGVVMWTELWLMYLLYVLEVVFNIVLLIGAHRKDSRLIRSYYYYGIVTTLAVFLIFVLVRRDNQLRGIDFDPFEVALAFSAWVLNCYLLFLVRAELNKMRYQEGQFRFVNHMAEVVVDPLPPGDSRNHL